MEINTEEEFYTFINNLFRENKITEEERSAMGDYVRGIFDALSDYLGIGEEHLI